MSEETDAPDAVSTEEPSVSKEPSFHGRLQLKDFMFNGTAHMPPATRRSSRLQKSQTPASASSESATPAPESASEASTSAPRAAQKRKARSRAAASPPSKATRSPSPSPRKKRVRAPASYAPPSAYAHLSPLTDVIAPNLLVLFIGLNPGVQTARSGHAYAHPSNLFWKLLYTSGLTSVPCRPEEDGTLPARFSLGNTNIVSRPSRNGAELSRAEMDAGVAVLEAKCRRWRPEAVCLVGKSIWESVFRVWRRRNLTKAEFAYGWQAERMGAVPPAADSAAVKIGADAGEGLEEMEALLDGEGAGEDGGNAGEGGAREKGDDAPWEGARVFVATSTSGLAASLRLEEKERIWKILGDWCVQRRKERAEENTDIEA